MSKKKKTGSKSGDVTQKLFVEAGTGIGHEKDGQRRCLGCMELYSEEYEICPYCGYTIEEEVENALHMFPGTVLYDKYIIGRVIGYGGFGVTYLAWDTVLQIKVAIKEYLPSEFSTRAAGQTQVTVFSGDKSKQFSDGMEKFIDEAKRLAKFRSENGIVKIFDSFSENGTAYIAMEYLQGETLAERLEREKTIPVEESIQMLMPIIESLNRVHDEGIIHRDIAPDNIFLTNKGEVKLIDFGASRYATTSRSRSLTVIIKPGYSAEEQYRSRGDQGSHTDVYSVGAVLYRMVTGQAPPDAMERRALFEKNGRDMLIPIKKFDKNIDQRRENAIYNSLNIRIEDRTPDMITLAGELLSEEPVKKRRSGIKKIDPLTWPLWAKIGIPSGLVAVVALCVLLAFGVIGPKSALGTEHIIPEGQVAIPNIVQNSVEDAQEMLRDESLTPKIHDRIESAVIDRNLVLRQDPDALNVVNKGSIVRIIISDGRGMAIMPDVVGLSLEFATQQLEERGFVVATEEEPSELIARGAVISQDFDPESAVEKGTTVTLKISTGSEKIDRTKKVKVPNIIKMDYDKAVSELKKYNLSAAINNVTYNSSIPENQVVGQLPYPNEEVFQGDTVYVTVNRKQKTVDVINYIDKPFEDVAWELREKGLVVEANYVQNKDYSEGRICGQNIVDKTVPVGTKIVFDVSEGYLVKVENYAGQKQSQAEKSLTDLGLEVTSTTEYSDTVKKGNVIKNDHVGEKVEQGTLITLVVSSGKQPEDGEEETQQQQQAIGLTSINITSKPKRTEYYVGDRFDSSGIEVVAKYSDSSNKNITSQCRFTGTDFNYKGYSTVTVTYEEGGISKTASFDVKVLEPTIAIGGESSITVFKNERHSLNCTTKPEGQTVTWHVEDDSVVSVSGGTVTGKIADGRTSVWATLNYNGKEYTSNKITVFVKDAAVAPEPDGIKIDGGNRSIMIERNITVSATVTPGNLGSKGTVKWSSDKPGVAEVKAIDGTKCEIRGKGAGTATIKATTYDSKLSATITVTVTAKKVVSLSVTPKDNSKEFAIGEKIVPKDHLNISVKYEGGNDWEKLDSSEYNKITLSNGGTVGSTHAESQEFTVTYKDNNSTVTAKFSVKVAASKIMITEIPANGEISLGKGVSKTLRATVVPTGAAIEWDVIEGSAVTVNRSTGEVKGIKAGSAVVRVRQVNNTSVYATVKIIVTDKDAVQNIEFKTKLKTKDYYIGETVKVNEIEVWAIKSEGREQVYDFTCSPKELNSEGSQTITISYAGYTLTDTVNVKTPSVKMKNQSVSLSEGDEKEISVDYEPFKTGVEIKWSSSSSVVTVVPKNSSSHNSTAVIKGVSGGEATITATITYNDKTYSLTGQGCKVTVKGKDVSSIGVSGSPSKTTQYIGDVFDPSGLTVTAYYTNNTSENIPLSKVAFTTNDIKAEKQTITASYGGKTDTLDFTFTKPTMQASLAKYEVDANNEMDSIQINTSCTPSNSDWSFSYTNLSTSYINVSSGGLITGKSATTDAKVKVIGKYKGVYETSYEITGITVKAEVTIDKVEFNGTDSLTDRTYKYGEVITTSGISAIIHYSDGNTDPLNDGASLTVYLEKGGGTTIVPSSVDNRGMAKVIVKYTGKQGEVITEGFDIEVATPTLDCGGDVTLAKGEFKTVSFNVKDSISASDYTVELSPSSPSDFSYSNKDKNGVTVEGKSAGSATVTAKLMYKGKELASDSFTVNVIDPNSSSDTSGDNNLETVNEYAIMPSNEEYGD